MIARPRRARRLPRPAARCRREGLDELVCEKLGLDAPPAELGEWDELTERIGERRGRGRDRARRQVREAARRVPLGARGAQARGHPPRLRRCTCAGSTPRACRSRRRRASSSRSTACSCPAASARAAGRGRSSPAASRASSGIPYLGICLGMHVAVSEFARHVVGLDGANSTEMDPETPYPVIDLLPEQKEIEDLGGTMRLGAQAVELAEGTRARETYGEAVVHERHRHRYEVNNQFRDAARRGRPRRLGDVPGGAARRDRRAARPPVVRREPVPPGVQVAPDAAGAALPRVRRRRARAGAGTRSAVGASHRPKHRACHRGRSTSSSSSPRSRARRARSARSPTASTAYLRDLGLEVDEDDAGAADRLERSGTSSTRGSSRPTSGTPIFLCAHLDTVPPDGADRAGRRGRRRPERRRARSSARTTSRPSRSMLEAARRVARREPPARGRRAPVHAEGGGRAARRGGVRPRRGSQARLGYVYDQAAPIGEVILGAPYAQAMQVRFHGRAAHAGMYPEEGRSAIAAAARAIADLRLGRIDEETTRERRRRSAAGRPRNIVPEWCTFDAEARSHDRAEARRPRAGDARRVRRSPPALADCEVETEVDETLPRLPLQAATTRPCGLPPTALERAGYEPTYGAHGRRRRRERLQRARPRRASTSRTGWRRSTRRTSTSPSPTSRRMVEVTLALVDARARRDCRLACGGAPSPPSSSGSRSSSRIEVDGVPVRRVSAADRAGRGRRRGARQHPGARARARLGRLRRRSTRT